MWQRELTASYPAREYCVQYRETDFQFVSRLMEEEGIHYFFEHDEDGHRLIIADTGTTAGLERLHALVADADEVEVVLSHGTSVEATIVGSDKDTDLALLKVEAQRDLPATTWGDSDQVLVGQRAVAIGNPVASEKPRVASWLATIPSRGSMRSTARSCSSSRSS